MKKLAGLPGIGICTAQYIAMRAFVGRMPFLQPIPALERRSPRARKRKFLLWRKAGGRGAAMLPSIYGIH